MGHSNSLLSKNNGHGAVKAGQIVLIFVIASALGFLFLYWLSHSVSPDYWPTGVDIYPRWVGTRAFWDNQSPYSPTVDLETQRLIYRRPAYPGEDSFGFYYPAYAAVVLAPLSLLPVEFAAILWSSFMWGILVTVVVSSTFLAPNRLSPIRWGLVLLAFFLYRPALLSVLNGQYAIYVAGCLILAWWMIRCERYFLAGFLLSLSMIKPSLALIPIMFVAVWSLLTKRAGIVLGMLCTLGAMLLLSFWKIGWWIPDFVQELGEYSRDLGTWTSRDFLSLPGIIWILSSILLIGLGCYEYRVRTKFPYALFFGGLLLNLAVTPHTLEYDLAILILPLLFLVPILGRSALSYIYLLVLIWAPWISWFAFTLAGAPIEVWWKAIWQFYPFLIACTLIITTVQELRSTPRS